MKALHAYFSRRKRVRRVRSIRNKKTRRRARRKESGPMTTMTRVRRVGAGRQRIELLLPLLLLDLTMYPLTNSLMKL